MASMKRELEPMQLISVIRLTKRAGSKKFKHIPVFLELLRTDDALVVKTTSYPCCLKNLLKDRKLMAEKGWHIILGLLQAFQELKKMRISLEVISPANVYLSEDLNKLILNGIQDVTWHGEPRLTKPVCGMPYSNRSLPQYALAPKSSFVWDLWSIGVIILEVLVGPDLVRGVDSDAAIRELL